MADTPTPEAYFTQVVPQQYAAALAAAPAMADQPPLTAVFEITGPGGGIFSARTAGTQIEVQPGEVAEQPDMRVTMSYDDWRVLAESGATDSVVDYVRRGKVRVVQGLKGTVTL